MPFRYIVVVPVFKHSVLVADALRSLLSQEAADEMKVVVIDDGCPYRETVETLATFQATYPEHIAVYRQTNRGLSGARNTGIEIALRHYPESEGIYFLDADNMLESWAMKRAGEACTSNPDADWFFPDIANFGLRFLSDYRGKYDILELLQHNYCEAGSFVRMRVFKAGIRFDESMKLGYEDWDFWLQATALGFRGQHLPDSGFRYRKRGESMLSNSDRDSPEILGYIRRKHRHSFSPKRILQIEATERARSLFVDVDLGNIALGLDCPLAALQSGRTITADELAARLAGYPERLVGKQAFFATQGLWKALAGAHLLHWLLWECERLQDTANIVAVRLMPAEEPDQIKISDQPFPLRLGDLFYMGTGFLSECANDPHGNWLASLDSANPEPSVCFLSIQIPSPHMSTAPLNHVPILREVLSFIDALRGLRRTYGDGAKWKRDTNMRLGLSQTLTVTDDWHQLRPLFPRHSEGKEIHVGFVLPLAAFGGVERVAHQTALALRSLGMVPHLIIVGSNELSLPSEFGPIYETVRLYRDEGSGDFKWTDHIQFNGTGLPALEPGRIGELAGMCGDLDVIINNHSAHISSAMGILKRCGILTAVSQHVFDLNAHGRPNGHPFLSLAFEHVYDVMLPVSRQMEHQMHGLGVPRQKLIRIQNASGFPIGDHDVEDAIASRESRQGPLRCLFMGRLDPQKGADRLERIIARAKLEGLALDWRVIGKAIIHQGKEPLKLDGIVIEPPVLRGADITERLAWADVLVLPSRYEGLPLVLHEAMSFGVVVIASDVGAVSELVIDQDTGYLVSENNFVEKTVSILRDLQGRPDEMRALGRRASAFARTQSWTRNVEPLANWIREETAKRKRPQPALEKE